LPHATETLPDGFPAATHLCGPGLAHRLGFRSLSRLSLLHFPGCLSSFRWRHRSPRVSSHPAHGPIDPSLTTSDTGQLLSRRLAPLPHLLLLSRPLATLILSHPWAKRVLEILLVLPPAFPRLGSPLGLLLEWATTIDRTFEACAFETGVELLLSWLTCIRIRLAAQHRYLLCLWPHGQLTLSRYRFGPVVAATTWRGVTDDLLLGAATYAGLLRLGDASLRCIRTIDAFAGCLLSPPLLHLRVDEVRRSSIGTSERPVTVAASAPTAIPATA
jgi:hypothetical protein